MKFDRYEILTNKYRKEIEQWDWKKIQADALTNCFVDDENNTIVASSWLGTPLGIYPSGKIYTFWTTNQTRSDVIKDECFIEALEAVADKHGMFINYDDDIFAQMVLDHLNQVVSFVTEDEEKKAQELFF
jgi:hypothetical protein